MNFAEAMEDAVALLAELDAPQGGRTCDPVRLRTLLQTEEGARGFFATMLTGEFLASDEPPPFLVQAIKEAPDATRTVLVKNLVMSAATEVVHIRNQHSANAAGSKRVMVRTKRIFKDLKCSQLKLRAQEMRDTIAGQSNTFDAFFSRVNYDAEQKTAALQALNEVLA